MKKHMTIFDYECEFATKPFNILYEVAYNWMMEHGTLTRDVLAVAEALLIYQTKANMKDDDEEIKDARAMRKEVRDYLKRKPFIPRDLESH